MAGKQPGRIEVAEIEHVRRVQRQAGRANGAEDARRNLDQVAVTEQARQRSVAPDAVARVDAGVDAGASDGGGEDDVAGIVLQANAVDAGEREIDARGRH